MVITPTPKQREAHKILNENTIVLYGGAIRGGKSYWLLIELLTLCFNYPKSRWLILRASYSNIERTILVSFNELMNNGLSQYLEKFDSKTMTATFNNGSQIMFMAESYDSDKELNRFRGLEINGAGIDEINEIQEVTFNKVIERSGSWNGCRAPIKILCTCNPTQGWVKDRFYDRWQNNTLPNGWAYVPAKLTDNPYLNPEYVKSLRFNMPKYEYEVFVEGNWDVSLKIGGEFYKCFDMDKHIGDCNYRPDIALHISFDENVNPYLPCGIFQIVGTQIFMIDEIAGKNPNNTIKSVCNEFKRKYPNHKSGLFIYGDSTSQKEDVKLEKGHNFFRIILSELSQYNPVLRVSPANPSVPMRGSFINTVLESNYGAIKVVIDRKNKHTINDFVNVKEAPDGTKAKIKETDPKTLVSFQKWGHFTDLFDYFICQAFINEYNNYQRGGAIPASSRQYGRNAQNDSKRL
jgi:hypothetical protein